MLKHWPPLSALRGFEAAARLGSFHRAAEELHLSQSAISQQIRQLEDYLQQPLFHRQGRSISLSDAGADLYATVDELLLNLAAGIHRLEQYRKPNQLIVNTSPALARHVLLPHLAAFRAEHSEIDVWLYTSDSVPDMASQEIDLCLRDELSEQAHCHYQALFTDALLPLRSAQAPSHTRLYGEGLYDWSRWHALGKTQPPTDCQGFNFSDPGVLLDAAAQGLGEALGSWLLSSTLREQGILHATGLAIPGSRWGYLVHQSSQGRWQTQAFCHWLERLFNQLPPAPLGESPA